MVRNPPSHSFLLQASFFFPSLFFLYSLPLLSSISTFQGVRNPPPPPCALFIHYPPVCTPPCARVGDKSPAYFVLPRSKKKLGRLGPLPVHSIYQYICFQKKTKKNNVGDKTNSCAGVSTFLGFGRTNIRLTLILPLLLLLDTHTHTNKHRHKDSARLVSTKVLSLVILHHDEDLVKKFVKKSPVISLCRGVGLSYFGDF